MCNIHEIHKIISYSTCSYDSIKEYYFVSFTGHQESSQSDPRTTTNFGSFELLTCVWLQKGRSPSHSVSSLIFWLRCVVHGFTCGLRMLLMTGAFSDLFKCESG